MTALRFAPGLILIAAMSAMSACLLFPVGPGASVAIDDGDETRGDGDGDGDGTVLFNGFECKDELTATAEDLDYYDGEYGSGFGCRLQTSCEEGEVLVVDCRTIGAYSSDDPTTVRYVCTCTIGGESLDFTDDGLCGSTDQARDRRAKEGCDGTYY